MQTTYDELLTIPDPTDDELRAEQAHNEQHDPYDLAQ